MCFKTVNFWILSRDEVRACILLIVRETFIMNIFAQICSFHSVTRIKNTWRQQILDQWWMSRGGQCCLELQPLFMQHTISNKKCSSFRRFWRRGWVTLCWCLWLCVFQFYDSDCVNTAPIVLKVFLSSPSFLHTAQKNDLHWKRHLQIPCRALQRS